MRRWQPNSSASSFSRNKTSAEARSAVGVGPGPAEPAAAAARSPYASGAAAVHGRVARGRRERSAQRADGVRLRRGRRGPPCAAGVAPWPARGPRRRSWRSGRCEYTRGCSRAFWYRAERRCTRHSRVR